MIRSKRGVQERYPFQISNLQGHKENYSDFCGKCFIEYTLKTDTCLQCGEATITQKARREYLLDKANVYNEEKQKKKERLNKWKLWKKTKAMFWKKTATDYEKWEYFTDSEDEFEKAEKDAEPIVPENDPQFMAMKKDLDERAARRRKKREQAEELKVKGNEQLKKKNYSEAINFYSQAIDLDRGNHYIWTNRALAHIKKKEFEKAVEDCSKVLQSCEVLEDGYEKSKDACFKALSRRALAYKGKENYEDALKDAEEALKLFPEDKSIDQLKEELMAKGAILKEMKESEDKWKEPEEFKKGLSLPQQHLKEEIEKFTQFKDKDLTDKDREEMKNYDFTVLSQLPDEGNKTLNFYFFKMGGLDTLKRFFKTKSYNFETSSGKINYLSFLHLIMAGNHYFMDQCLENNFVRILMKRIYNHLHHMYEKTEEQKKQEAEESKKPEILQIERFIEIEEFSEFLILLTKSKNVRLYLREKSQVMIEIIKMALENLTKNIGETHHVFSSVLTLFSNLMINEAGVAANDIKDYLIENQITAIFCSIGDIMKQEKLKFLNLKKSCLAFISNFMIYPRVRSFSLALLINATSQPNVDNTKEITDEEKEKVSALYFFESVIKGCINILKKTSEKRKNIGENTRKLFENVSGVFLNLTFGINDKEIMRKVENILNDKSISVMSLAILQEVINQKGTLPGFELMCKRYTCIFARYYSHNYQGKDAKKILSIVKILLTFYKEDLAENELITGETTKLIVVLLQKDAALKPKIYELIDSNPKVLEHTLKTVLAGSENKVKYVNSLTLIDHLIENNGPYLKNFKEAIPQLIDEMRNKADFRRNRAMITMAKLCQDPENRKYATELHGMELLINLNKAMAK